MLLEPNVVADMKRDLAEKGIIAFPPDLPQYNRCPDDHDEEACPPEHFPDSLNNFHG